jgi:hypothetical protein
LEQPVRLEPLVAVAVAVAVVLEDKEMGLTTPVDLAVVVVALASGGLVVQVALEEEGLLRFSVGIMEAMAM